MEKIEQALEKEINRDNCIECKKLYLDKDGETWCCGVTEEAIGSGDEYCELKEI